MDNLVYLVLVLAFGKLSQKWFPENTSQVLNLYVIWISFPATVLLKLNGLDFDTSLLVLALVLGIFFARVPMSGMVLLILQGLSATLVPLAIFSVGAQLRFRQPLANITPLLIILGLKMVVAPVVAAGLLMTLGVSGPVFQVAVFEAAMPSMVMAGILSTAGNLRSDVVNAAIGYGILLSFITLPLLFGFIH